MQPDRALYATEGFVLARNLISAGEAAVLFQDCLRAVRGEIAVPTWREYVARNAPAASRARAPGPRGEGRFTQLAHPSRAPSLRHWRDHPCYARALAQASALCPAEGLFFAYDQCFYKPSGSQAVVFPHQDAAYWRVLGITCWIALSEVTAEMAPVQYYRRTHARFLPHVRAPQAWNDLNDFTVDPHVLAALDTEPVSFVLEPGDGVFHSSLTVHGSGANRGARPRCGLALHFQTPVPVA
jgi:ectoine hydroxylase-related dioxygenase (phytanoyl-CoA dioxygenase family)